MFSCTTLGLGNITEHVIIIKLLQKIKSICMVFWYIVTLAPKHNPT